MSKVKKLFKDTLLYMFGTLGSKVISLFLLPVITVYITTSQYGTYDLITTTVSMLVPIFSLQIIDSLFRFLFSTKEEDKGKIISAAATVIVAGIVALAFFLYLGRLLINIPYANTILVYYVCYVCSDFLGRVARCIGRNGVFAISGVITTIVFAVLQIVLIVSFHMGLEGIIISYVVSSVVTCVFIESKVRCFKYIRIKKISKSTIKELTKYSSPLIFNSISWWAISSINKYIISMFLSTSVNGLYAVSLRFSSLITLVANVFILAWQESAIREYGTDDYGSFFEKIMKNLFIILGAAIGLMLPVIQILYPVFIGKDYQVSLAYIPLTMVAACFQAISSFLGSIYLATKDTKRCMTSSLLGGVVCVLICFLLIKFFDIYAVLISTVLGYVVIVIARVGYVRRIIKRKLPVIKYLFFLWPIVIGSACVFLNNKVLSLILLFAIGTVLGMINKDIINGAIGIILSFVKGWKKNDEL